MKDLAEERNVFNTTLLIWFLVLQLIMTNEAFTMNGSTHTHKRVRASAVTYANERSKPIEDYSSIWFAEEKIENVSSILKLTLMTVTI